MIYEISFANKLFASSQRFNARAARRFGADKVIKYTPKDIEESFKQENADIWNNTRGYGYWIWKPYITLKTLEVAKDGDFIIYMDAGACFTDNISILTDIMNKDNIDIMIFCLHSIEKKYTKRDAFILLDCDEPKFTETPQRCATYFILRKSDKSMKFIKEWLKYAKDRRIITNDKNVMGLENYEGFIENRHDQSILSLLSKKWNIKVYRDPAPYGLDMKYPQDVLDRSPYGQVVDAHRYRYMPLTYWGYKNINRATFEKWYRFFHKKPSLKFKIKRNLKRE